MDGPSTKPPFSQIAIWAASPTHMVAGRGKTRSFSLWLRASNLMHVSRTIFIVEVSARIDCSCLLDLVGAWLCLDKEVSRLRWRVKEVLFD